MDITIKELEEREINDSMIVVERVWHDNSEPAAVFDSWHSAISHFRETGYSFFIVPITNSVVAQLKKTVYNYMRPLNNGDRVVFELRQVVNLSRKRHV